MEKVQNTSTFHQRLSQTNQTTFYKMLIDFLDKNMVKIILSRFFIQWDIFSGHKNDLYYRNYRERTTKRRRENKE